MGYYADGSGSARFKEGVNTNQVTKILEETKTYIEFEMDLKINGRDIIDFYDSEKYYEDETMEFLNALVPFIDEGEMTYSGEDGCHWRFVFDPETGKWNEENGEIIYSMSNYEDDKLIEELTRRGYTVTKAA